jgi:glycosyltransferase involved in cell wall biosynthesis
MSSSGKLHTLITDIWTPPDSILAGTRLIGSGRHHHEVPDDCVSSLTLPAVTRKYFNDNVLVSKSWHRIIAYNNWFQNRAAKRFQTLAGQMAPEKGIVFAYSYAAGEIFKVARDFGWSTILGQIDPGPAEARIADKLHEETGIPRTDTIPDVYWKNWDQETRLADRIIVNSEWSRNALTAEGLDQGKIRIVPLAYQVGADALAFERTFPQSFSPERPLKVLFLGQVGLRKGIYPLLQAFRELREYPVELTCVGEIQIPIPDELIGNNVRFLGPVSRAKVDKYYREADLFIFPSHSDGFGTTLRS